MLGIWTTSICFATEDTRNGLLGLGTFVRNDHFFWAKGKSEAIWTIWSWSFDVIFLRIEGKPPSCLSFHFTGQPMKQVVEAGGCATAKMDWKYQRRERLKQNNSTKRQNLQMTKKHRWQLWQQNAYSEGSEKTVRNAWLQLWDIDISENLCLRNIQKIR